jgi:penicillin-binding protein 1A
LTPEKSYQRKLKEAILAYRIDKALSKEEILYLYLNQIYMGHGAYGVQAAAENYFGKSAKDLNLAECAMLAGLPQAPSKYSPVGYPDKAKERQIYVINRMVAEGFITNLEATEAINTKLEIQPRKNWFIEEVPYYTEHVRQYAENKYGPDALYTGGLKVYTAVNIEMQNIGRSEIDIGLRDLDKRQGYRGPVAHLAIEEIENFSKTLQEEMGANPPDAGQVVKGAVVEVNNTASRVTVRIGRYLGTLLLEDMKWARKPNPDVEYHEPGLKRPSDALSVGDVIWVKIKVAPKDPKSLYYLVLEQDPKVQAALLCIETESGHVKVMVGGRDFRESQFNRATQSRRQPGSAFKPIIYAAALDKGYTPATMIIDSPIVFRDTEDNFSWKPKNYKEKFFGPTLLREALAKSRNVVTIKILQDIGVNYAIDYARKLGIISDLYGNLSLALGASGVSLFELTRAYSVFANSGYLVEPVLITRVLDRDGKVLEKTEPKIQKVIEKSTAYLLTNLMESVVKDGTGWRVRALNRPVAGKTGTTNNLFDAWFIGYTPRYVTGVWVGFDEEKSLGEGETGSRSASPIWLEFMRKVLADKPVRVFQVPEGVVFIKIDAKTGLLPIPESEKVVFECFKEGTAPTQHTRRPGTIANPEEFYKSDL